MMQSKNKKSVAVMSLYADYFGLSPQVLQRLGCFVVAWGLFESHLELATLVLLGEKIIKNQRLATDCLPASELISCFRKGSKSCVPELIELCDELANAADDLLVFRNAITHGRLLPPPAGGPKFVNNASWFGEKRKRQITEASLDNQQLDIAIECANTIGLNTLLIHIAARATVEDQLAIASQSLQAIKNARNQASILRSCI
jgi:hypothetical protein